MRMSCALVLLCLTACADFPVLDDTITDADRAAPYPELVNIAPILTQANSGASDTAAQNAMAARVAALQARAARLRRLDI